MIPHLAVIVVAMVCIVRYDLPFWLDLAASLVIGSSFAALGFLGHEILHGSVVKNSFLRDTVGALCFAQFTLGPKLWRKWHNVEHHGHTQFEDDPDAMGTLEDYRERPALQVLYKLAPWLRSFLTFASFTFWFWFHAVLMLVRFAREFSPRDRIVAVAQFLLPAAGWCALLVWIGPGNFIYAYIIPFLVANFIVMSYIATNHLLNPLTPVNDPLANSLTVTKPRWLDVMHFNFSHHTEHHIFPSMNPKYAPKVKALAKEMWPERYNEMPHWKALLTLWRTPRLYRENYELADPGRQMVYPALGHGLDPDNVRGIPFDAAEQKAEDESLGTSLEGV